jgi:hypothetical protein
MTKRDNQVSVPLDPELRAFVERAAEREDRSVAGQIRHLVAEAARNFPKRATPAGAGRIVSARMSEQPIANARNFNELIEGPTLAQGPARAVKSHARRYCRLASWDFGEAIRPCRRARYGFQSFWVAMEALSLRIALVPDPELEARFGR